MEENKVADLLHEAANLNEIPPQFKFDENGVWVKIQMKMETERALKRKKWPMIFLLIVAAIVIGLLIYARINYVRQEPPIQEKPQKVPYQTSDTVDWLKKMFD